MEDLKVRKPDPPPPTWCRQVRLAALCIGVGASAVTWAIILLTDIREATLPGLLFLVYPIGCTLAVYGCFRILLTHVQGPVISIIGSAVMASSAVACFIVVFPGWSNPDDGLEFLWMPYILILLFSLGAIFAILDGLGLSIQRRQRERASKGSPLVGDG